MLSFDAHFFNYLCRWVGSSAPSFCMSWFREFSICCICCWGPLCYHPYCVHSIQLYGFIPSEVSQLILFGLSPEFLPHPSHFSSLTEPTRAQLLSWRMCSSVHSFLQLYLSLLRMGTGHQEHTHTFPILRSFLPSSSPSVSTGLILSFADVHVPQCRCIKRRVCVSFHNMTFEK